LTASEKLKQKKLAAKLQSSSNSNGASSCQPEEAKSDAESVGKLTEIANKILSSTGNMDIYQETTESIKFKVRMDIIIYQRGEDCLFK
jgi:hypothetical protein